MRDRSSVKRRKCWRDVEIVESHSWNEICWCTEWYKNHGAAMNTHWVPVASKRLCRWKKAIFGTQMTLNSHFWQFPEWQPFNIGKKPEFISEAIDGAIKRKPNGASICKTHGAMALNVPVELQRCVTQLLHRQSLRAARGKFWRDIEQFWQHSWSRISCSIQRYHDHWPSFNSVGARVASKKMCR